ncbi:acyl-CoA N-acyltransferase [Earliella scabrosa]|nr:acyl-CoA N-acyltransferase [Earliella scabrosa]
MAETSQAIENANKATVKEIVAAGEIPSVLHLKDTTFTVQVCRAKYLPSADREHLWSLWTTNMRTLVEPSSFGWHPKDKKKELFHADSRLILVYHQDDSGDSDRTLVAFCMFRFELGYEDEDAVYCYEFQVADGFRGCGLGRFFVETLTRVGKHWQMEKLLLTVLKSNMSAREAYAKLGFVLDTSSPEYGDGGVAQDGEEDEDYDYEILSKPL